VRSNRKKRAIYCNLTLSPNVVVKRGYYIHCPFQTTKYGFTLEHIKDVKNNFNSLFAIYAADYINYTFGEIDKSKYINTLPVAPELVLCSINNTPARNKWVNYGF